MSKCKYPAAYKFFTIAQHYFITGLSLGAEYISLDYVIDNYSSHYLLFGHTSPQLVDHGIYELARKMKLRTYLIFVISFTQAKFLENKIYTKKRVN